MKISFVGDLMCLKEELNVAVKSDGYDFKYIFEHIRDYLQDSDYVVGNLETPLAGGELGFSFQETCFNTPPEFAEALKYAGFSLLTTANNHCMDRGLKGVKNTLDILDQNNLAHIGTYRSKKEREKPFVLSLKGMKLGFLAYTSELNTSTHGFYLKKRERDLVNICLPQLMVYSINFKNIVKKRFWEDIFKRSILKICRVLNKYVLMMFFLEYRKRLINDIKSMKKENVDQIVMCLHSGGQYNLYPDSYTKWLCRELIKAGVDIVVGAHPHVVHLYEKIDDKYVFYSLGNFISTDGIYPACHNLSELYKTKPNYSIILHLYILNSHSYKITFSIAKYVKDKDSNQTSVYLLSDLIESSKNEKEKRLLEQDNLFIYNRFTNRDEVELEVKTEYKII